MTIKKKNKTNVMKVTSRVLFFVLLSLLFSNAVLCDEDVNLSTGLRVTAQNGMVNELDNIITPALENLITQLVIPTQTLKKKIFLVGTLTFELKDITFTSIDLSNNVFSSSLSGFSYNAVDATGTADFNWSYRLSSLIPVKDSGRGVLKFSKSTLDLSVGVGFKRLKPYLEVQTVDFQLGKINVDLSGSWVAWIYDIIVWLFKGTVKDAIQTLVDENIETIINENLNNIIQGEEYQKLIYSDENNSIALGTELSNAPVFRDGGFTLNYVGSVELNNFPAPFLNSDEIVSDLYDKKDINIIIDQYVFESLSYALYKTDVLDAKINGNMFPEFGQVFNTAFWQKMIPGLFQQYPNEALTFKFETMSNPSISIETTTSGYFNVDNHFLVSFLVDSSTQSVLDLDTQTTFLSNLHYDNNNHNNIITADVFLKSLTSTVDISSVGDVNIEQTDDILYKILIAYTNTEFNDQLKQYPLPFPIFSGIEFINVDISVNNKYILFGANVSPNANHEMKYLL
eukprot:TRINITY_DN1927_c0_g1_i1.p1 TRINITY_DN1927_c0_g1~~TRINITY_DN1927_c0_g1_i1.p1  ORF type:complete len:512 (-),score=141.52 TRINITY_DN1927_c0_g1_i1:115-1650(-)